MKSTRRSKRSIRNRVAITSFLWRQHDHQQPEADLQQRPEERPIGGRSAQTPPAEALKRRQQKRNEIELRKLASQYGIDHKEMQ
ncbi:hypothetical protein AMS64_12280 [Aeromonas veronii]|nr:hypothetical protein AMS64_12280 [Aeromonas veronii]